MLTYDYECPECGVFEQRQRITDDALEVCPTCGKPIKRIITRRDLDVWWVGWPHLKDVGLL